MLKVIYRKDYLQFDIKFVGTYTCICLLIIDFYQNLLFNYKYFSLYFICTHACIFFFFFFYRNEGVSLHVLSIHKVFYHDLNIVH